MTIASKFFYCRRTSASSRSSEQELDRVNADRDRRLRRDRRSSHEERRPDGPSRARQLLHPRSDRTPHESIGLNKSTSELEEGISRNHRYASGRVVRSSRVLGDEFHDHLPDSVLEARTRLQERLKGVHLTGSRQESRAADISDRPPAEVSNVSKCNHWKTATASDQLKSGDPAAEIIFQAEQVSSSGDINKKPCVLGHRLKDELFIDTDGDGIPKGLLECSICLEKFSEGEGVIRLPCGHMYHHACLEPWMQAHQLCPYCRASVVG
ncbi:unnamed protein product [Musa acuminata subsp. malaccensis]|uniref:(wild Malaysian banana) hypothetical protein n=1 Tax=Musa acuminata subsp. malaccensis TaxID=214687 RepID=A0A804IYT0_MUSAM|nr:PREDICTED: probable E3 ubiquitin-protein ligase RHY1A [Musa acuminata subsp. malaccensis]CAG1844717.1 unnamed protein product [Musa acuminata subsp. malaccensis]